MRLNYPLMALVCLAPLGLVAQKEKVDAGMMERIKKEGLQHSKVMDIAYQLTDVSGPRLTGSPGFMRAANYAKRSLSQWGLAKAALEPWGEFGKSWELQKCYVALTSPWYRPIQAWPKTWTAGTNGIKKSSIFLIKAKDSADLVAQQASLAGKLRGKIVMLERSDSFVFPKTPDLNRYTEMDLDSMEKISATPARRDTSGGRRGSFRAERALQNTFKALATTEGALAIFSTSPRNHEGTIFAQGGGLYGAKDPVNITDIAIGWEDYLTLQRLAKDKIPVRMEMEVQTKFYTNDLQGYNVIAEIPGTDLKDEVVIMGAHLDSWQAGTGATDNAAGCAVMLEAVRILKTLGIHPRRTIRIILWSGEEEGLLGSKAYVKKNYADPAVMELLPAHQKVSAYYNLDNGSGKIRGIYLQENEAARQLFHQWLEPFANMGAHTVTYVSTGSTDHVSFDAVGIPGFQFIQDSLHYLTRTHHSNADTYEHLSAEDLKQASVIVAAFVYNTAMRDAMIPRKKLPEANSGRPNRN